MRFLELLLLKTLSNSFTTSEGELRMQRLQVLMVFNYMVRMDILLISSLETVAIKEMTTMVVQLKTDADSF
jgi:hypothetical protein